MTPMKHRTPPLVATLFLLATSSVFADEPVSIGSRLEPLMDTYLVESMSGTRLVMHRPTPREVAIVYDAPWEGNTSGYVTVIHDGDLYRMYYRGHAMDASGKLKMAHSEVTCYAESPDGIHWEKPELGLFEWEGSSANNIIWMGDGTHNFSPFIDTNPNCAADARYKAIGGTHQTGLIAFKSSDGVHWSKLQEKAVFTDGAFDSQNVAFWDAPRERYLLYFRFFSQGEFQGLRSIAVSESVDFVHWSEQQPLMYTDSPPQQMYTNQVSPYYRAPHVLIGFPTRYVARELTEHVKTLDPVELRAKMTKSYQRTGTDLTDGLLMTSRDGLTFSRWDEAFLRPGPQGEGRWMYGDNYQALGLVETAAMIPGGPAEISLYAEEESWRDDRRLRRFTIRQDGFVSAQAPLDGGEIITKPIVFAGRELVVNYSTSAAGSLRVELRDATGETIGGYSLDDCPEHYGDSVAQTIHWQAGADVSSLAGQPIRIRFVLKDADLYSFRFGE